MLLSAVAIGIFTAVFCSFFNYSLIQVTNWRKGLSFLPFLFLPLVGICTTWLYQKYGNEEERGNNLIIEEIHFSKKKIRFRLVPLIIFTSLISHFFGASVGREGVGVQIGGGIADQFKVQILPRRLILMMGMSAGFGAIFYTPFAGAIFGIEVFHSGALALEGLVPCFISSYAGFLLARQLFHHSSEFPIFNFDLLNSGYLFLSIFLGLYFGIIARFTNFIFHKTKELFKNYIKSDYLKSVFGGIFLILVFFITGSDRYLGLGSNILEKSFYDSVRGFDFLGKIFSTSISLAAKFKGGEVMPIFYIGATSGNALATLIRFPISFFVPIGMVSVFAGCANVPLTAIILAIELFGTNILFYAMISVLISYLFSGHIGIYSSQMKKYKIL